MRGYSESQPMIIAYINLEKRVPQSHPLRMIKMMADRELTRLPSCRFPLAGMLKSLNFMEVNAVEDQLSRVKTAQSFLDYFIDLLVVRNS